jgi:hypothetical protein
MKGFVLLDTLVGLSVLTITLMFSLAMVSQATTTAKSLTELRSIYISACNNVSRFRASDSDNTDIFYQEHVHGKIYFEYLQ